MPGKAYTMREMRKIVDYLVEQRAYEDLKGRKMWMDFANSKQVDRTWQSLKETFLKRILPDIHNPYYKLTPEQIASFRQGYDVAKRNIHKLKLRSTSEDSRNITTENHRKDNDGASTSKNEENPPPGENVQCSKIQPSSRSSMETLVLENCYKNAEEILRELESPKNDDVRSMKSLKDLITYSEPLTPMLQEVIDDFATDDEETPLQIVEEVGDDPNIDAGRLLIRESVSLKKTEEVNGNESKKLTEDSNTNKKAQETREIRETDGDNKEKDIAEKSNNAEKNNKDTDVIVIEDSENKTKNNEDSQQRTDSNIIDFSCNDTPDSLLPNNQEGFKNNSNSDKRTSNEISTLEIPDSNDVGKKKTAGKNLQLKTKEHKNQKEESKKQLTETNSVIEITEKSEEPIVIDSHSTIEPEQDSAKNIEDSQQAEIPDSKKITNTQKENSVIEIISNEKDTEQKDLSKENNSQEAGPSALNNELNDSPEINPCLKSVSLYAELFSQPIYSDSDSSDEEQETRPNKTEGKTVESKKGENILSVEKTVANEIKSPAKNPVESKKEGNILSIQKTVSNEIKSPAKALKTVLNGVDDVVLLKSHSESDSEHFEGPKPQQKKKTPLAGAAKTNRDNVLANIFGFSSGAVSRKRSVSHRSNSVRNTKRCRTISRSNHHNHASASSSSISSDSEPPCSRKERNNGNYLKPKSYDILTEAGGGGLFVIGDDRKLHEIVMSGKHSMNHLYFDENREEATDGFWRKKFFEEKLRADELSRLLKNAQQSRVPNTDRSSPILRANPSTSAVKGDRVQTQLKGNCDKTESKTQIAEDMKDKNHVKIKFTKDNEIELECQWPHVHPVLEQMAQMFHKNTDKVGVKASTTEAKGETTAQVTPDAVPVSGMSTPVIIPNDPVVQERIDKIESEIFKEIEERDKTDKIEINSEDRNVTKRTRGKPRKALSLSNSRSSSPSEKKAKTSSEGDVGNDRETVDKPTVPPEVEPPSDAGSTSSKRPSRPPKRFTSEPAINFEIKKKVTRASISKKATSVEVEIPDDSQVRYMFPKSPTIATRSNSKLVKSQKNDTKRSKSYPSKTPRIFSSPDNSTTHSIESTQGYQDSDNSPTKLPLRRKRKLSGSSHWQKGKEQPSRKIRRKSCPYLADDDTIEDIAADKKASKAATARNSSLDTEVYRSESYQLLLPKARSSSKLKKIDELGPLNEVDDHFRSLSPLTIDINEFLTPLVKSTDSTNSGQRVENSSNVSLPLSPELSVVENISISKDMISLEDHPTLNETQANDSTSPETINKYVISDVDVSAPLMGQDCELRKTRQNVTSDVQMTKTTVSESLLSKICTVNLEEPSSSDSLRQKLHDMLLESAKKMSIHIQDFSAKENMEIDATASELKKRAKKRCSTPRKKKDTLKSKAPNTGPVVEEERIEFCSRGGRSSCPPSLNVADLIDDENKDISTETNNNKGKKKKDIIKVKILRPKNKNRTKDKKKTKKSHGNSCISVCTDSGINDTESGVFFLGINDSVDLIHNHSETCMHANECIGDSVEFLDNTAKSVLSISSNTSDSREGSTPDLFCNDAREATSLNVVTASQGVDNPSGHPGQTNPFSPASFNSLITEDLSDEAPIQSQPRPSKWYLVSEEETTNTNIVEAHSPDHNAGCFNANLKHLFPITCAVPDLSTITEMSRENDSRKPTSDVSACNDLKHSFQSIFD